MGFLSSSVRTHAEQAMRHRHTGKLFAGGAIGDGHADIVLTGNITLVKGTHFAGPNYHHRIIRIDPGGAARTVTLPTEAEMDGWHGLLVNAADGDEALTFKDDSGATTIATVGQNEAVDLWCDGTNWWGEIVTPSSIT